MSFGVSVGDFVAVLSLANKLRKDFVGAPSQYRSIAKEVRGLSIVLQDVDDQLPLSAREGGSQNPELDEISHGCHILLKELENELDKYRVVQYSGDDIQKKAISVWKRVSWDSKEIRELRDRLVSNMTLLQSFLSAISSKTASATKELLDVMNHRQEDQEKSKILDWLITTDYNCQQDEHIGVRQAGTGKWLLDSQEYEHWTRTRQSSVLALGIPGAGKTICSAIVVDDLTDRFEHGREVGIAYLYCNFKRQEEQNVEHLLASLLKQLSQRMLDLPDAVRDMYDRWQRSKKRPRFDDLSKALHAVVSLYSQVFIVIDALDECGSANGCRARLLAEIMKLQRETGANVFATSRPMKIDDCLKGAALLEIRAREDDIRKYVRGNMFRLSGFVTENVSLQEEIENTISQRVQGMFLLAKFHFESLVGRMTVKTTRTRLKELSEGTDGYDKAYDEAMQRINAQLPEQQELAIKSLAWITFAKRSLTALELRHALAIEDGKSDLDEENIPRIKDVLSVCAGLLNTDGGIVHLVHYTAQEYFERTHTRWFAGFSETHISNLCVTYISFDSFGTGPSKTNQAFGKRIRKYPFYVYVAHHWGNHAREAQNCGPEVIRFLEDGAKLEASVQTLQTRRIPVYSRRSITTLVSGLFSRGTTGLHVAAYFDFHQLVNLLLQHHHILETRDSNSCTPLIWACNFARRDSMATINLLLASGAYIDAVNKYYETPLYLTASDGDEEAVQLLLDFGADINGNNENDPPLVVASEEGHLGVVNLLLSRGADPNRTGMEFPFGETPLERASSNGHLQIVELLLKEGADVTAHALKSAVSYGYEDVFEILLAKATSIPSPSAIYEAALCAASEKGNHSIVQTLLNKNTDVNAHYLWETPLIAASKGGQISMVQFLLVHGADVDENDDNYITALQEASCTGHLQIVKILLQHGANINQNGRRHGTALQAASGRGCLQIVEFLLQRGADPLIRGGPKKTALEAARWSRYENIVELLKKHIVEKRQRQVLDSVRLNSEVPQMDSIDSIVCE